MIGGAANGLTQAMDGADPEADERQMTYG